jgi:hypothetical protein
LLIFERVHEQEHEIIDSNRLFKAKTRFKAGTVTEAVSDGAWWLGSGEMPGPYCNVSKCCRCPNR